MENSVAARYAVAYGASAENYARILDPTLAGVASRVVELAEVGARHRVLDLATGTGIVARAAAEAGASVVGVDISPGMVALARSLAPPQVEFVVADAARLPFESASFDAITCGFGFSHMSDIGAVLAETRRVLRPGGSLVEASWGSGGRNPAFGAVLEALEKEGGGALHAFAGILDEGTWADAEQGTAVLRNAGCSDVRVVTEPLVGWYADPQCAIDWTLAWPDYGETAAGLAERAQHAFHTRALVALQALTDLSWEFWINYYIARTSATRARDGQVRVVLDERA